MTSTSRFLTAEWRKLAIANYAVDPDMLLPYLPYKTELDFWNDSCYVSLVGFMFIDTRIKGLKIPFHSEFEEVNLRFYVRYKDTSGWRRGVCFIREIVPKPALTFIANTIYSENYMTLDMEHDWSIIENAHSIAYHWLYEGTWNKFSVLAETRETEIFPGSEEEFIAEHYWGYTKINEVETSEYGVEHPRWKEYKVKEHRIEVEFGKLYGDAFSPLDTRVPDSVMLAEGSEIVVRSANKIL